jgi:hypothetical protein
MHGKHLNKQIASVKAKASSILPNAGFITGQAEAAR